MKPRPDFMKAYDAVEVPSSMLAEDAIDQTVARVKSQYFEEIQDSLDLSSRTLGEFFEYKTRMLVPVEPGMLRPSEEHFSSDDYITTFRRVGGQALASVMLTRDDYNYSEFHFAKYTIHPRLVAQVRELQHLERIECGLE